MENEYYLGLDIGTDSVGYAVTDTTYKLKKFKGEPMWGATLFDAANGSEGRRGFRTGRRRLDRRQQRVKLYCKIPTGWPPRPGRKKPLVVPEEKTIASGFRFYVAAISAL